MRNNKEAAGARRAVGQKVHVSSNAAADLAAPLAAPDSNVPTPPNPTPPAPGAWLHGPQAGIRVRANGSRGRTQTAW